MVPRNKSLCPNKLKRRERGQSKKTFDIRFEKNNTFFL